MSTFETMVKRQLNELLAKCPLYLCNPDKNVNCSKESCAFLYPGFGECRHTTNPQNAETNENGTLARIMSADEL